MDTLTTEVLSKSYFPPKEKKLPNTIGYYASFIVLGLGAAVLGPTLPGLAAHTHTGLSQISILFTTRSVGFLFGTLRGGRLYDRVAGHPILVIMLLIMAVMEFIIPLLSPLWLLIGVILMWGIAEGMIEVGCNTLLVWVHRDNVTPFMNGLHFFFGIGAFLAPIIVAQAIARTGDLVWAYWVLALLIFPVAAWILVLPSPPIQRSSQDHKGTGGNLLLRALVTTLFLLYVGAEVSFGGWIFTYTITLQLSTKAVAAYLTSVFWGSLTLGRLLAIPISLRMKPYTMLLIDFIGCILSVGLILLWSNSLTAIWVGTMGTGVSMASVFPTLVAFAGKRMALTAKINGIFFAGAGIGAMSFPWLIGQLFESIGPRVTMVTIMINLIVTVSILLILGWYSNRKNF